MIKKKALAPAHLLNELARLRTKNPKLSVVFTNGCFDLLHAGHVIYLEKARTLGDILIVALNTDESVKRLKGPSRPLNSIQDRSQVIAALESVSFTTWFGEDTPLALIKKIKPNILVKGGDYSAKNVVGYTEITELGGKVKIIPFVEGKSTTGIIAKAKTN